MIFFRNNRRNEILFVCGGLVGCAVFFVLFGPALNPLWDDFCRGGFVEKDILQHYAGWLFLRESSIQFPLCFSNQINWPDGISVAYTDSIPLFAAIFRLFSNWLPQNFQYFGIFSLLCYFLQGGFASLILAELWNGFSRPIMGSILFSCSPILIERTLHHTALAAHFFILACYYYYLKSRSSKDLNCHTLWLLNAFSITIHPYLVPLCFSITFAMLVEYALRTRRWKRALLFLSTDLAAAVFLGWCVGLLGSGVAGGSDLLYGYFSMNLNALWNPVSVGNTVWSIFLPTQNQIRGNYDAFNYLGFGILICISIGIILLLIHPRIAFSKLRSHWCLAIVCLCLTTFAITNQITANGAALISFSLPDVLLRLFSVFRSSGRFFWPVYYLLFLFALKTITELFHGKIFLIALISVICIQLADISPALISRYNEIHFYQTESPTQLTSSFWEEAAPRYEHLCSLDTDSPQNDALHLALWAVDNQITTNDLFAARYNIDNRIKQQQDALAFLNAGIPDSDTLYITQSEAVFLQVADAVQGTSWCGAVDGQWYVIAPGMQEFSSDDCIPYSDSYPLHIADYTDGNWMNGVLSWDNCTVLFYDNPLYRARLNEAAALCFNGIVYPVVSISDADEGWLMVTLDTQDASPLCGEVLSVVKSTS